MQARPWHAWAWATCHPLDTEPSRSFRKTARYSMGTGIWSGGTSTPFELSKFFKHDLGRVPVSENLRGNDFALLFHAGDSDEACRAEGHPLRSGGLGGDCAGKFTEIRRDAQLESQHGSVEADSEITSRR